MINKKLLSTVLFAVIVCAMFCFSACSKDGNTLSNNSNIGGIKCITLEDAPKYKTDVNKLYYSTSSNADSVEVYYRDGVWVMYTNGEVTNMQQYLVPDWNKSLADNVSLIPNFDASTTTYYGYNSSTGNIAEVDSALKFKDLSVDYVFVEWGYADHYYAYVFQNQDVSTFNIYKDAANLFRVYAKESMNNQGNSTQANTTTDTPVTNDQTNVTTNPPVTEAPVVNDDIQNLERNELTTDIVSDNTDTATESVVG